MASDQQLLDQRITWDAGADTITDSQYSDIIKSIEPNASGPRASEFLSVLKARHVLYWHHAENMPSYHNGIYTGGGDCNQRVGPQQTNVTLASTFAAKAAQADPEPISKTILSVFSKIAGIFGANHARQVALEQNDLCQMSNQINQSLDVIDAQVQQGNLSLVDASSALSYLRQTAQQIVAPTFRQNSSGSVCNAPCVEMQFLDGLIMLREKYLYPVSSVGPLGNILPTPISQGIDKIGSVVSGTINTISGGTLKISTGLGIVIALILVILGVGLVRKHA